MPAGSTTFQWNSHDPHSPQRQWAGHVHRPQPAQRGNRTSPASSASQNGSSAPMPPVILWSRQPIVAQRTRGKVDGISGSSSFRIRLAIFPLAIRGRGLSSSTT